MRLFSLAAGLAAVATGLDIFLDTDTACGDFQSAFIDVVNDAAGSEQMKGNCKSKKGGKKYFCHLNCVNGHENVWSTRKIKCKRQKDDSYKWKPKSIKGADGLCEKKERCGRPQDQYNLTNILLSWTKTQTNKRTTTFTYKCGQKVEDNKVFDMVPYPVAASTCTCNYNKPSNVRCKWSKVKNSIVRCVRQDRAKGQSVSDDYYEGMYDY